MRDVLLSVDLDFWRESRKPAKEFFKSLFESGLKICVSVDHHDLLPFVNSFPECRKLINIDYHSDICPDQTAREEGLTCGDWVNFVDWPRKEEYIWIYPSEKCAANYEKGNTGTYSGWCHAPDEDPFKKGETEWEKCTTVLRLIPRDILKEICSIAICLSPDYFYKGDKESEEIFAAHVSMIKGLCKEYGVKIIPSKDKKNNEGIL